MNLGSIRGSRIVFIGTGGWPDDVRMGVLGDVSRAKQQGLVVGNIYEVDWVSVGQSISQVYLKGVRGCFNTVMFENVDKIPLEDGRGYYFHKPSTNPVYETKRVVSSTQLENGIEQREITGGYVNTVLWKDEINECGNNTEVTNVEYKTASRYY